MSSFVSIQAGGYALSIDEWALSVCTLTSFPLMIRHFREATHYASSFGAVLWHRTVGLIEAIPCVGILVGIIEKIFAFIFSPSLEKPASIPWRHEALSQAQAEAEMEQNLLRACRDHAVSPPQITLSSSVKKPSLTLQSGAFSLKGSRPDHPRNEDRFFSTYNTAYMVAGVCDGHGGPEVSSYVAEQFASRFLKEMQPSITEFQALEHFIATLQKEIEQHPEWNDVGTSLVVSLINKETGQLITANLGHTTEAFIVDAKGTTLPLSPLVDWSTPEEQKRLKATHPKLDPACAFYPRSEGIFGLDSSRSLGDKNLKAVSHQPLLTEAAFKSGQKLVICSKGALICSPKTLGSIIQKKCSSEEIGSEALAYHIVCEARKNITAYDTTALVIQT